VRPIEELEAIPLRQGQVGEQRSLLIYKEPPR